MKIDSVNIHQVSSEREHRELIAVAARAFWNDALFNFLTDNDLLAQYEVLPHVFALALAQDSRTHGSEIFVYAVQGQLMGFASWLPPGTFPRTRLAQLRRYLHAALLIVRLRNRRKAIALLQEVEQRHPTALHWYLSLLATDPSAQGHGIGTRLLETFLTRCDTEGVPAYTETQKYENVEWYRRRGFAVVDEIRLPDTPPVWRLWRDPVKRY